MARTLVLDVFQLTILIPHGLPEAVLAAIQQVLDEPRWRCQLLRACRRVCRRHRNLRRVRLILSR